MTHIFMSVIMPTYNRHESLRCTLNSLCRQNYPVELFEVIIVDDGSIDSTAEVEHRDFPFMLRYLRQENRGGVAARNHGAEAAHGKVLVFLDDDMTVEPGYLAGLASEFSRETRILVRGKLVPWDGYTSIFARHYAMQPAASQTHAGDFSSNNLAVRRDDFFWLGGWKDLLQDVTEHRGGIWSDLEFAVRASQRDYRLINSETACIVHRDYAAHTLEAACQRAFMVSKLAVSVVKSHPFLAEFIPMLHDKEPINWGQDSLVLVLRKLVRQLASSRPVVTSMLLGVHWLENHAPSSKSLLLLYRWLVSAWIYRGYRAGLALNSCEIVP